MMTKWERPVEDVQTPTPGWLPPNGPTHYSPAKNTHEMTREWAESILMTDHLVCYASRRMVAFHESFLDKSAAISTITAVQTEIPFLAHWALTTHRPRFARNRSRYGAAFTSASQALQYAARQMDVRSIYMLPTTQCQVIDTSGPHVFSFVVGRLCARARECVLAWRKVVPRTGREKRPAKEGQKYRTRKVPCCKAEEPESGACSCACAATPSLCDGRLQACARA